ncbi:putative potassium transport system protein kup 3 [Georgfuchsia toluolica]|uniref:Probable potassium transport system protein Kup n=1 Tax=Georgfuchsia toluolica TaxID=424218 RepID=A0A916J1J4_9PROT|nr:potassium transporter Kup [Georgfuchsia toluolica]CAG4882430.1 putative potassium transport system protein kup 3 [Georgfuchsia toluolica]
MSQNTESQDQHLAPLTLAALGVVYGDIGTSPLYAVKEVFAGHHPVPITPDNVIGILSVLFWALMIVVTLKYVTFMMRANNKGEGGTMAIMALALRNSENSPRRRQIVIVLGLFGAALFFGDGVITPAISVLSAVEGLKVIAPSFDQFIIPITLTVLIALFLIQRHGTSSIGFLFGPVMLLWFSCLAIMGVLNIVDHPAVLKAISPYYGLNFLVEHPLMGYLSLGAVVLVLTGAEALYADMGHFGQKPIQIAWIGFVLPALLLNYFGQGALLLANPEAIDNPFYRLAPGWALYPLLILATMATVIASQAVISGAYSVTVQAIQLGYAPRLEVQHTSDKQIGQIYLPTVNWLLWGAVIALVIGFGSSTRLASAYGIAVTGTMLIDNVLAFVVTRWLWAWGPWRAVLGALPFFLIDIAFFTSNLGKIKAGGWFPLVFGIMMFTLLMTWKRGRSLLHQRLAQEAIELEPFITSLGYGGMTRVAGTAVFLNANPNGVPHAMLHSLKHYKTLHEQVVLVSVNVLDVPYVGDAGRVVVGKMTSGFWRVKVFYGFKDEIDLPQALEWCAEQGLVLDMMDTSFFLGRETLIPRLGSEMPFWQEKLFIALFRNAGSAASFFKLPPNRVIELGTQIVL